LNGNYHYLLDCGGRFK